MTHDAPTAMEAPDRVNLGPIEGPEATALILYMSENNDSSYKAAFKSLLRQTEQYKRIMAAKKSLTTEAMPAAP